MVWLPLSATGLAAGSSERPVINEQDSFASTANSPPLNIFEHDQLTGVIVKMEKISSR